MTPETIAIVENALRYSGSKTIEISLVRVNGRSKISVVDHGIGIAENILQASEP